MLSLCIQVPHYAKAEAEYTFNVLFGLISSDISITYLASQEEEYTIMSGNTKLLTIVNLFFTNQPAETWYTQSKIPNEVLRGNINIGAQRFEVTALYGEASYSREQRKLNLDLVSSAFYMLTRWEETIHIERDEHGRFDQNQALAVKSGFIQFPIVNEYAALMKAALGEAGVTFADTRKPKVHMTFDIDTVQKYESPKTLLGDLTKRYISLSQAVKDIKAYTGSLYNSNNDPYFCFDYILDELKISRKPAHFYFKTHITHSELDENKYSVNEPRIRTVIAQIINEGHGIGLHPSYEAATSKELLGLEVATLQKVIKQDLKSVRMHYLRMTVPDTLHMLIEAGFTKDSSSMYSRNFGFRNGICTPFMWFNIHNRAIMPLEEVPPIAMTTSGIDKSLAEQQQEMKHLIDQVTKHKGEVAIVWHNSDLDTGPKRAYFEAIIDYIGPNSNN